MRREEEQMPIVNRIAALHGEIIAWRRDIHAHPELLYDVQRTAATVADKLKGFGCDEVVTGIGRTGVVGVIRGGKGGEDPGGRRRPVQIDGARQDACLRP
jgi:metal-dependent amidase/aminoacylase/carboxypeptidase family protein